MLNYVETEVFQVNISVSVFLNIKLEAFNEIGKITASYYI